MTTETVDAMSALEHACLMRDAAAVQRYHTVRTLRQQTLADHTFGVMMLIRHIYPDARREVYLAAMHHDLPEFVTGDMPAPAKAASPALAILLEEAERGTAPLYEEFGLTPHEESVLKWCDYMELVLWCLEEVQMGNAYAGPPARKALTWLRLHPNLATICTHGNMPRTALVMLEQAEDVAERLGVAR